MIIFDKNSKNLDIPVGLGNLEVNIVTPVSPGSIIESAVTEANQYTDEQIESALTEAKNYTDEQIEGLDIPNTYVLNLMTNEERAALCEELFQYYQGTGTAPSSGFPAEDYNFYVYLSEGYDNGGGFVPMRFSAIRTTDGVPDRIFFEGIQNGYAGRNFKAITCEFSESGVTVRNNFCSVFSLNGQKGKLNLKTINNESILGEGNIDITGGTGSSVSYEQLLSAGTEIGQITIDGSATTIYAPAGGGGGGATTGEVQTMIDTAMSAETARTEQVYLKDTDLTNYYTSGQTDQAIQTAISGIDLSNYYNRQQTDSAISTAVQNKVSSTAVATIWKGTQAQYDAIASKGPEYSLYYCRIMTNNNIDKIYAGTDSVSKVFLGTDLIWPYTPPVPPTPVSGDYLTFEIISGGTINWETENSTATTRTISYSLNGGAWTDITSSFSGTSLNVSSGDRILFKGTRRDYYESSFSGSTAFFNITGNIMSLLYGDEYEGKESLPAWGLTFVRLFSGTKAVNAQYLELPATTLSSGCYIEMFLNCTELVSAPALPATSLKQACYQRMFKGCSSLTTAPALPATSMVSDSEYYAMFSGCSSLTAAPALPATTLTPYCYYYMFGGCSNLTTAPELPALTLREGCYSGMFRYCTNLNYIKCLAVNFTPAQVVSGTDYWVTNVSGNGTFVKAASATWETGDSGIPSGWTIIDNQ